MEVTTHFAENEVDKGLVEQLFNYCCRTLMCHNYEYQIHSFFLCFDNN